MNGPARRAAIAALFVSAAGQHGAGLDVAQPFRASKGMQIEGRSVFA